MRKNHKTKIFAFSRSSKLVGENNYKLVMASSNVIKREWGKIYFIVNPGGDSRLGISIMRKSMSNAVQRNKIKRVVREQFRGNKRSLLGLDLVVVVRLYLDKKTLHHDVREGFLRLQNLGDKIRGEGN